MNLTNALGTVTSILGILTLAMEKGLGCTSTGDLAAKCTSTLLPAQYMLYATVAFGALTLLGKALRPGGFVSSMLGSTAVVVPADKSAPGVVTKAQVASK